MRRPTVDRLRWLITLPLAIVLVVFAVNNRALVEVDLWPLGFVVTWPLFVFAFLGVSVGLLVGALFAWISGGTTRKIARQRKAQIRELESKVRTMQARLDDGEAQPPARPLALPE